ncbi:MAG: DUF4199 domain-containing protein [Bacteroidales bacterium]|nr:DUF4199 domain-containing protein [Bacteroidales bacterium]
MDQENKWSCAAMDGLYLSIVTVIYTLVLSVLQPEGFLVRSIIWIAKFAGCLYLLWYFMKKWSDKSDTISYGQSFNYGFIVCIFSSIVCACFGYAQVEWLFPEQIDEAFAVTKETMAAQGSLNSTTENALEMLMANYGRFTLFISLFYYAAFGAVASAITANFTKKENPFGNLENE